jgi:poly(hydroxyalkanoate) depolymerase family esterase
VGTITDSGRGAFAGLAVLLAIAVACAAPAAASAAPYSLGPGMWSYGTYDSSGDPYGYAMYVPSTYTPGSAVPLVVAIHGCGMSPDDMALATGWNDLAEQHDFIVLYPDVDAADTAHQGCWKGYWDPGAEGRGSGDAAAIAGLTRTVMATWKVDPQRVYAIGLSSGAMEASILGASYPDLYAAIGIHSGTAYMGSTTGCFYGSDAPIDDTDTLASDAYAEMGPRARVVPVIVFHGDADESVEYRCGQQALTQALDTDNLVLGGENLPSISTQPADVVNGAVSGGLSYTVNSYAGASGCVAQFWTIHGLGHLWSGGPADYAYVGENDPDGPDAASAAWAFFEAQTLDATQPCPQAPSSMPPSASAPVRVDGVAVNGAPVDLGAPRISGAATVGRRLTVSDGEWSGRAPITYTYRWDRCGHPCTPIAGATASSYRLTKADLGRHVAVVVYATNAAGSQLAFAVGVGPVAAAPQTVRAALRSLLARSPGAPRTAAALRRHGYGFNFGAPSAGRLTIRWYALASHEKPVLIASAASAVSAQRRITGKVRLTAAGRRMLSRANRLKLRLSAEFRRRSGHGTTATRTLRLRP